MIDSFAKLSESHAASFAAMACCVAIVLGSVTCSVYTPPETALTPMQRCLAKTYLAETEFCTEIAKNGA